MKKIFFAMLILAMGEVAIAQEKTPATGADKSVPAPSAERKHHKVMHHAGVNVMKNLNLSDEQKAKLKEMRTANKEKRDAILNDSKLSEDQKKQQLSELHKGQKDQMKDVLTDEQKAKLKELKAQRKSAKKLNGKIVTSLEPAPVQK